MNAIGFGAREIDSPTTSFRGLGYDTAPHPRDAKPEPVKAPPKVERPKGRLANTLDILRSKRDKDAKRAMAPRPRSSLDVAVTHIVFNPLSVDSMMASAALLTVQQQKGAMVPYDRFTGLDDNLPFTDIRIVGVELSKHDVEMLLVWAQASAVKVTIFAYRDQYHRWPELKSRMAEHFTMVVSKNEEFGDDEMARDNTMCRLVQHMYYEQTKDFKLFAEWKNKVAQHACGIPESLDYQTKELRLNEKPHYKDMAHLEKRKALIAGSLRQLMANRVAMQSLRGVLRTALGYHHPLMALRIAEVEINDSGIQLHRGHIQAIRVNVKKNLHQKYVGGSFFNKRGAVLVSVMAVPESLFHDTMIEVRREHEVFMGYEDTKDVRIYRISADDYLTREKVAATLKVRDIWTEGTILCVATDLPTGLSLQ